MSGSGKRDKTGWARALLGGGFVVILIGLVIGRVTDGGIWARYVAFAGMGAIAFSLLAMLFGVVRSKIRGEGEPATDSH